MIGFFGGTFDPLHFGHIHLALALKEYAGLEEVWFCPAYTNPFKEGVKSASPEDRLVMLQKGLQDIPGFRVLDDEIKRPQISYTIDTLRELILRTGKSFRLLLGSDQLENFELWKDAEELKKLAPPLVGSRRNKAGGIDLPLCDISATDIRKRIHEGLYIGHLVPQPVLDYIKKRGLYLHG